MSKTVSRTDFVSKMCHGKVKERFNKMYTPEQENDRKELAYRLNYEVNFSGFPLVLLKHISAMIDGYRAELRLEMEENFRNPMRDAA